MSREPVNIHGMTIAEAGQIGWVSGGTGKSIVSPLKRLLLNLSIDQLLTFLHRIHVQFALSSNKTGTFHMVIYKDGMVRYKASNNSPQHALVDAICAFLVGEQKDINEI